MDSEYAKRQPGAGPKLHKLRAVQCSPALLPCATLVKACGVAGKGSSSSLILTLSHAAREMSRAIFHVVAHTSAVQECVYEICRFDIDIMCGVLASSDDVLP